MNLKSAVIYWIHLPEHTDYLIEGYVGVTKYFDTRIQNHHRDIIKNKHKNPHLVNAVRKYGWENLLKDTILSGEEAYCYEIEETMRPKKATGWNIAPGGHRGPGWTKGRKKSPESIKKQKQTAEENNRSKRKEKIEKREIRLKEQELKRIAKQQQQENIRLKKVQRKIEVDLKKQKQLEGREQRIQKKILNGTFDFIPDHTNRPICKTCNKNYCAINCTKNNKTYYRSICDECGRKKKNLKPRRFFWQKSGYKKKATCDLCGFKSLFTSQITVFHIDGKLENASHTNLRSICLNCVEVVKKKEVNWKRGDLQIDY